MDYTKLDPREYESKASASMRDHAEFKRAGFERLVDRAKTSLNKASNEREYQQAQNTLKLALDGYNKYHLTNHKS